MKEIGEKNRKQPVLDYTGQKFTCLTVLSEIKEKNVRYFICRCDCGRKKRINKYCVLSGTTKTCGAPECMDKIPGYRRIPLIGQKYNHFTVLSHYLKGKIRFFVCRCDCGNVEHINASVVRYGRRKSCKKCTSNDVSSKDHIGKKYNFLTVLSQYKKQYKKGTIYYFLCKCDFCGREIEKNMNDVVKGRDKTCGLSECRNKIPGYMSIPNHVGKKYGKLTVLSQFKKDSKWFFTCQCDCGRTKTLSRNTVIENKSKSCGCLQTEVSTEKTKKFPVIITRIEDSSVYSALITMGYRGNGRKIGVVYCESYNVYSWYVISRFQKKQKRYRVDSYNEGLELRLAIQKEFYMPYIRRNKKLLPKNIDVNYWLNLNNNVKFDVKKYERDKRANRKIPNDR